MNIKQSLKRTIVSLQIKLLSQKSVLHRLTDIANQANTNFPLLNNDVSPYKSLPNFEHELGDGLVFVTSRFRSGSTLLWNIFRQSGSFTAFYEPFNERRWFDEQSRGGGVDQTHRGVDDYWAEYNGLQGLNELYNEDWIRHRLLMGERHFEPKMKSYIESLVASAKDRPVLQFNRIDFRLGWIKAHFPNSKLLHLYRHPRDQWCSFLTDKKLMNKDDVADTYIDGFYLDVWCDDLAIHFPFLDKRKTPHPYQRFYYLWKLSYLFGKHYADLSLSFEDLTCQPEATLENLFAVLDVNNPPTEKLCGLIEAPQPDKWRQYAEPEWFEGFEQECEHQLNIFFSSKTDT